MLWCYGEAYRDSIQESSPPILGVFLVLEGNLTSWKLGGGSEFIRQTGVDVSPLSLDCRFEPHVCVMCCITTEQRAEDFSACEYSTLAQRTVGQ